MARKLTRPSKQLPPSRVPIPSKLIKTCKAPQEALLSCLRAAALLVLAATWSPLSQLNMSPVYGSVPSSIHHRKTTLVAVLLAWSLKPRIPNHLLDRLLSFLPVLAFLTPATQYYLFRYSSHLGARYGPVLTEMFTYSPLVFISTLGAAALFEDVDLSYYGPKVVHVAPKLVSYAILTTAIDISNHLIRRNIGKVFIFTRLGLQVLVSTLYSLLLPSKALVIALLPLLHILSSNVHSSLSHTTAVLNSTLHAHDFVLLARQESLTGYISVLDNLISGYRVMRCDHSLLGGEWLQRETSRALRLKEPIYSVFVTLEAVRLVKPQVAKPDNKKQALVIGLGVGTTPSALIAHGINTTVVEIDPTVYDFAIRYFNLPLNHTAIIDDATVFVEAKGVQKQTYDYIIHDVFSGGVEPINLFTQEFLNGLNNLLSAEGVIAINYAGDLLLPTARIVVNTIRSIFPSCRIYREDAAPPTARSSVDGSPSKDFTNMILFCRKSIERFDFRHPMEADYLGSQARRYHLFPEHEIHWDHFKSENGDADPPTILRRGHTKSFEAFQNEGALGHWSVMRTVLPDAIWENW